MTKASLKDSVVRKVADVLIERCFPSEAINALANDHFSEMIAVVCRDHLQDVIVEISKSTRGHCEVIDALAKDHFSKMIAVVCRDHLQDVIIEINTTTKGQFKYVGDGKIKVVIGAGPQQLHGWFSTDINTLDITQDGSWRNLFNPSSIDNILAEHVVEHLSLDELYRALAHARTYLKPEGVFRIAVPDAFHPSRYYYNLVKPGGWETPEQHKLFFDYEMMTRVAEKSGYRIRLLEYFDEQGNFHQESYSLEDGAVQRCAKNNCGLNLSDKTVMDRFYSSIAEPLRQQFFDLKMTYTSLIVDFTK